MSVRNNDVYLHAVLCADVRGPGAPGQAQMSEPGY